MNDITPKEAIEILSHYTNLGYGIVIEGDDVSKIIQALSLARKTLANGIPYNPSGDLISRSALLNQIDTTDWSDVRLLVEDAPTVDLWQMRQEATENALKKAEVLYGRPQGEYISVDTLFVKCSICGNLTRVLKKYNMPNFCPACGADMRGGAE